MARRVSGHRVKALRTYTVEEAAEAAQVTSPTVRAWIGRGLRAMTDRRPTLILGADLKAFLASETAARKRPLGPGEVYCLACKAPRLPAFGEVDCHPMTAGRARLEALCGQCSGLCSRVISASRLPEFAALYRIGGNCPSQD